jgi:Na+/H+ antiporter NhaB
MKQFLRAIIPLLLLASIAFTTLGGWMDMTGQKEILGITKKHAWNDGLFLILFTIAILLYSK